MLIGTQLTGFGASGAGGADATINYEDEAHLASAWTANTFSSMAFGTATADRDIIVSVSGMTTTTRAISSITAGGVSLSLVVRIQPTSSFVVEIWKGAVPTGTTGDVVVTWDGALNTQGGGAIVHSAYGAASAASDTATGGAATPSNPYSTTIDIPAGGVAVAITNINDTGGGTVTWAGLTEDVDVTVDANTMHSGASDAFASTQTSLSVSVTGSGTPDASALAVASFARA